MLPNDIGPYIRDGFGIGYQLGAIFRQAGRGVDVCVGKVVEWNENEIYNVWFRPDLNSQTVLNHPFSTLSLDGAPDDGTYKPIDEEASLADRYDYVMHGRVFQYK